MPSSLVALLLLIERSLAVAATAQWIVGRNMSTARDLLGVAALNGKLYAVGGSYQKSNSYRGRPLASMEVFDFATKNWTTGPSMSDTRVGLGVTALNDKIYAVGGSFFSSSPSAPHYATMEVFDPATNNWTVGPNMHTISISQFGLAALNGKLYAVGGQGYASPVAPTVTPLRSMEVFNPATDTWNAGPSMSEARQQPGVAALDGKLYAVGGLRPSPQGTTILTSMEVFDPATNWAAGPDMTSACLGPSLVFGRTPVSALPPGTGDECMTLGVAALNGQLYVVLLGGIAVFDPATSTWTAGLRMIFAGRNSLGVAALEVNIYSVGGMSITSGNHSGPAYGASLANMEYLQALPSCAAETPPSPPLNTLYPIVNLTVYRAQVPVLPPISLLPPPT